MHEKYGPILRIAPNEVTFAGEEAWSDIFQPRPDTQQQFLKDPTWWERQPGMPPSLLSAIDPREHARIRKFLALGLTPRALAAQEPMLNRYVNLLVERMHDIVTSSDEDGLGGKAEIDMTPWFNFTTFDIFGDLGFGESFGCLENSRYHPWIALLFNSVKAASFVAAVRFYPLLKWLLMKCIPPSLKEMQRKHYNQIVDKVHRRLNWELERPDIMSHVIRGRKGDEGLEIGVINATFMVLTTAGSETTATVLSGTLNYLVNNPDKLAILTSEIRQRFKNQDEIKLDALRELEYLNVCLNEGLRLSVPIPWMLPRLVPEGGATTAVSIQAYTLNRRPDYFHSAASFMPERWLPEASTNPASPFYHDRRQAMQPFSTGPRNCMGQHLAWAELRLTMAKLLWNFDMEAVPRKRLRWEDLRTFLLVEKKPVHVRMRVRQ
ncbi:Isotrichodermin C-15 hydroxylase [Cytospora mali]|uniref:Isotrichodermin C-15 hydroxylase n=1 Tax=Cytospora mali TaxID=578113 RepID=A0A194VCQ7_CYTMA|nr:Isotrichodermin C-15 hydroxylase [Valsa mali var. pyri (nom. inval.)]